jgi:hypothetical protein
LRDDVDECFALDWVELQDNNYLVLDIKYNVWFVDRIGVILMRLSMDRVGLIIMDYVVNW